jgi:hypothetical protein
MKYLIAALLIASSAHAADKATYVGEGRYVCNDCKESKWLREQREERRERDRQRDQRIENGYRELREKVRSDR